MNVSLNSKKELVLHVKAPKSCTHAMLAYTNGEGVKQIFTKIFKPYEIRYDDIKTLVDKNGAVAVEAIFFSEKDTIQILAKADDNVPSPT
jgi:hypothetical protein